MKSLPASVTCYKKTPIFSELTVPKALLSSHYTKSGVWGKIVVLQGQLVYRILEPQLETLILSSGKFGVVEPAAKHEVEPIGKVQFFIEFHS